MLGPSLISIGSSISPIAGGVIAGVLHILLGPDHLCSIVTLSACQGAEAFWFGVRWATGHLSGMAVLGAVVSCLNMYQVSLFDFEAYEHYAYYFVGFMLMCMGAYFIMYADKYFDAEWAPKQATCACHSHPEQDKIAAKTADGYGSADEEAHHGHPKAEKTSSIVGGKPAWLGGREMGSVLIGFVQGMACPAGVVGMVFLKQYGPTEMAIFLTMFFIVTTLCMGLLAMAYGMLTKTWVSSKALGRSIYYASCALSLTLGALWIILNATGRLDSLLGHDHSHGEHGHSHSHGAGDHHHHDHGAGEHHHHHFLQGDGRIQDFVSPH